MFQCLGLASIKDGGCGEDWWHPECLMGLPRTSPPKDKSEDENEDPPLPMGFPEEDDFDHLICYKCVTAAPWIKQYAGSTGFLAPVFHKQTSSNDAQETNNVKTQEQAATPSPIGFKRKADVELGSSSCDAKKAKTEEESTMPTISNGTNTSTKSDSKPRHVSLPPPPSGSFTLFVKEDFRDHFCRCPECFPLLAKHPQLLEEEESYEPPMSDSDAGDANGAGSVGSGSTYERGEALLSNVDRVRAIGETRSYLSLDVSLTWLKRA